MTDDELYDEREHMTAFDVMMDRRLHMAALIMVEHRSRFQKPYQIREYA